MPKYDLVLDRRKTLTNQATNLLSFTGIINTILIAVIVALVTNKDMQTLLVYSKGYSWFLISGSVGFIAYISTIIFSLVAFYEYKWHPSHQINSKDLIEKIFRDPKKYGSDDEVLIDMKGLHQATSDNDKINSRKYMFLKFATISLVIGIIATIAVGAIILTTSSRSANLVVVTHVNNSIPDSKKYEASDFIMRVNGNNPSFTDFPGSASGVKVSLGAGSYAIIESKPESSNYSSNYSEDCTGIIRNDETKTCVVSNFRQNTSPQ